MSYRYKILHMSRQHSCRAMCKISQRSLPIQHEWQQNEISIKFELQWKNSFLKLFCFVLQWSWIPHVPVLHAGIWLHNTLRPKQNGWHFANSIFKCIFMKKFFIVIQISMKFLPKGGIDVKLVLVEVRAKQAPNHSLKNNSTEVYMHHQASVS